MLHRYLRSVGFSQILNRSQINDLIGSSVRSASKRDYFSIKTAPDAEEVMRGMFYKDVAEGIGICITGEFNENDVFMYDYYFPFLFSTGVSSNEEISIERHAAGESYEGLVDEARVGVSLIFYVNNMMSYLRKRDRDREPLKDATVSLSALSVEGTIMMPIAKTMEERELTRKKSLSRYQMIAAAKRGNEAAIESLTIEDMDTYTTISRQIKKNDVFTLVDSYFMPFGVECDHYSVLGEITECRRVENNLSGEGIYVMKLMCNDLFFDVCINEQDLTGEPAIGRRFKGNVWMQGYINYPDDAEL